MKDGELMYEKKIGEYTVKVVEPGEREQYLTDSDREMDLRASAAVEAAIKKAQICRKPIARYDADRRTAYIEYPDGRKEYVR